MAKSKISKQQPAARYLQSLIIFNRNIIIPTCDPSGVVMNKQSLFWEHVTPPGSNTNAVGMTHKGWRPGNIMSSRKINGNASHQKQSRFMCASKSELYMDRAYGTYVISLTSNPGLHPGLQNGTCLRHSKFNAIRSLSTLFTCHLSTHNSMCVPEIG